MVSDQPNIRNPLTLLIFAFIVLILTVSMVMFYLSARQASLAKTHPYRVELSVQNDTPSQIIAQYDYGYGYNKGHEQVLTLEPNLTPRAISFTVSAWKNLNSLRLMTSSTDSITVNNLTISKSTGDYRPELSNSISADKPLEFVNVHKNLLEVSQ